MRFRLKHNCKRFNGAIAPKGFRELTDSEPVLRFVLCAAVPAIDRPALGWLERDLSLLTTVRASYVRHFAWPIVPGAETAPRITSVSVHY